MKMSLECKGDDYMLKEPSVGLLQMLAIELFGVYDDASLIQNEDLQPIMQLTEKHAVDVLIYYQLMFLFLNKKTAQLPHKRAIA